MGRAAFLRTVLCCAALDVRGAAAPCTQDDLAGRAALVTSVCCDQPSEDCSSGSPATCNAGCAAVLVPYLQDCQLVMGGDVLKAVQGAAEHCPVSPCLAADLPDRVSLVSAECCDEPDEDCSSGQPASCNAGCAAVLVPYFLDCRAVLEQSPGGEDTVKAIKGAVEQCPVGACAPLPSITDGQWDVRPDGRQATLLCDQGACEIDDCVPSVGSSGGPDVFCVSGQWPHAELARCTPTAHAGGVVERTCNPQGMQELCTVARIAALADDINCHDPCVMAMIECADDPVVAKTPLGSTLQDVKVDCNGH